MRSGKKPEVEEAKKPEPAKVALPKPVDKTLFGAATPKDAGAKKSLF